MYDEKKDKLIKLFELDKGKTTILFKILSYDNNQPKLSISSMYEKRDGTTGYNKPPPGPTDGSAGTKV